MGRSPTGGLKSSLKDNAKFGVGVGIGRFQASMIWRDNDANSQSFHTFFSFPPPPLLYFHFKLTLKIFNMSMVLWCQSIFLNPLQFIKKKTNTLLVNIMPVEKQVIPYHILSIKHTVMWIGNTLAFMNWLFFLKDVNLQNETEEALWMPYM